MFICISTTYLLRNSYICDRSFFFFFGRCGQTFGVAFHFGFELPKRGHLCTRNDWANFAVADLFSLVRIIIIEHSIKQHQMGESVWPGVYEIALNANELNERHMGARNWQQQKTFKMKLCIGISYACLINFIGLHNFGKEKAARAPPIRWN